MEATAFSVHSTQKTANAPCRVVGEGRVNIPPACPGPSQARLGPPRTSYWKHLSLPVWVAGTETPALNSGASQERREPGRKGEQGRLGEQGRPAWGLGQPAGPRGEMTSEAPGPGTPGGCGWHSAGPGALA